MSLFIYLFIYLTLQVTHVRSLHTSGCRQQEAVAVESEPETFSVFRTQENDPVIEVGCGGIQMVQLLWEWIKDPLDMWYVY